MPSEAAPGCLDDETIAAFVAGTLEHEPRAAAEAHLARCAECRGTVADAAFGAFGTTDEAGGAALLGAEADDDYGEGYPSEAPRVAETHLPVAGHVLADEYRIDGVMGRGGMGVLFAARHLTRGERVAVKVMNHDSPSAAARFLREARILMRLASEHIPRVHAIGTLENAAPYIVMEYLLGEDLSHHIARGPTPLPTAIDFILQACNALTEAHAAGIIHRDLKPANLFLVAHHQRPPLLKVLDFGVSKFREEDTAARAQSITTTNSVLGSPLYMSPEQLQDSKHVDARTDIWSLGVILYQLLTGRAPFHGRSLPALCLAIASQTPAPPSTHRAGLPPAIDSLIADCLRKRREERVDSVDVLAERLRALCADQSGQE